VTAIARHACIASSAAIIAFIAAPGVTNYQSSFSLFTENRSVPGVAWITTPIYAALWLVFSLSLRHPRFQQWLILGFISPLICVPMVYLGMAITSGNGWSSIAGFSPLILGLIASWLMSWLLIPIGLMMGVIANFITQMLTSATTNRQPTTPSTQTPPASPPS